MNHDTRSLEEILTDYCIRGWFLFPVKKETKNPAIKNNLKDASSDINQLLKWSKKFPGCSWGISLAKSGLVAVDVDTKNGGMEYWEALTTANSEPDTLKQISGSDGLHYIFKAEQGKKYRGKIKRQNVTRTGIDVKHNGYIVIYPSLHPRTGKQYSWGNEKPITVAPEWIKKFIEKDGELSGKKSPFYKMGDGFFERIVTQLKDKAFGYDEWLKFGMALHSWDSGEKGLQLFLLLTEGVNYNEGDSEKARAKWDSFSKQNGGVAEGTLVRLARELGCEIPNPFQWADREAFGKIQDEEIEKELDETADWVQDEHGRFISVHSDFVCDYLNSEGYAMLIGESEGQLLKTFTDKSNLLCVRLLTQENFKLSLRAYFHKSYVANKEGIKKPKYKPASEVWLDSGHKTTYTKIVFSEKGHASELNLGGPIPFEPIPGDTSLFEFLCTEIISDGNKLKGRYLIQWAADIVQNRWRKCFVVPCLIGDQGTGKGLFCEDILGQILGPYFNKVMSTRVLKERFNVEQSKKFLTMVDEATWRGDYEESGLLKGLTGSKKMTVEEKFGGRYSLDNPSRYILCSNRAEAVLIEDSNRRFLTFNVSKKYTQNKTFFDEIYKGIHEGKLLNHIFDFLLKVDLKDFNPHVFPNSLDTGGFETKLQSRGPVAEFWWNTLFENPQKIIVKGQYVPKVRLFEMYREYLKDSRHWTRGESMRSFWADTKNIIKILQNDSREIRLKHDGASSRERVFKITPVELAKNFCNTFNISLPDSFDDLEYLIDDEFTTHQDLAGTNRDVMLGVMQ